MEPELSQIEKFILIQTGVLFFLGVLLAIVNLPYFHSVYVTEDGVLEWLTVLALGTVASANLKRLYTGYQAFNRRQRFTIAVLALLAAFGTGEEISWGQRLFAIETPEFYREINTQGETNIHNLMIGGIKINKPIFSKGILLIFLLYLGVMTPLYHRSSNVRQLLDSWAVPIPQRYHWMSYLIIIVFVEGLVKAVSGSADRRGELTEFAVSIIVALNIIFPRNQNVFHPRSDVT